MGSYMEMPKANTGPPGPSCASSIGETGVISRRFRLNAYVRIRYVYGFVYKNYFRVYVDCETARDRLWLARAVDS